MYSTTARFCPPQKRVLYSFRAVLINTTLLTLAQASSKGSRQPISYMRTNAPSVIRAIGVTHTARAKLIFDEIFDFTARVYLILYFEL